MVILASIDELTHFEALNQSIQSYNLTPHDNKELRQKYLIAIINNMNNIAQSEALPHSLSQWVEKNGLKTHMDYYKVTEQIKTSSNRFKEALSEFNSTSTSKSEIIHGRTLKS